MSEWRMIKWDVFLSHAGEDGDKASHLAGWINDHVGSKTRKLSVFNTSEPQNRFRESWDRLSPGAEWSVIGKRMDEDLRTYLRDNMVASRVYLLLVTPHSVTKHSEWIKFEIETAKGLTSDDLDSLAFIPCVTDGVSLSFPLDGSELFQRFDISSESGLFKLRDLLVELLPHTRSEQPDQR
jgi:hypothetical protein